MHPLRPFQIYAAADQKSAVLDSATNETVNLPELIFMMKEGGMIDPELTLVVLTDIFAKVNASFEESGDNDDAQELDFSEFQEVVARICHFKIPASQREGSAFELTLHTWLTLLFLPKYKALLKEKKRGTGKKHL